MCGQGAPGNCLARALQILELALFKALSPPLHWENSGTLFGIKALESWIQILALLNSSPGGFEPVAYSPPNFHQRVASESIEA